jgi:hypothetical protein
MNPRGAMACIVLVHSVACSEQGDKPAREQAMAETEKGVPGDSLVATAPGGVEIWFTLSREATAADGSRCIDRTMEIRRGTTRIPVPLLYTGSAPELVNDSTIRARLSNQCVPGDSYLVNLRTGRPVRER